jgi:hypothetical protein
MPEKWPQGPKLNGFSAYPSPFQADVSATVGQFGQSFGINITRMNHSCSETFKKHRVRQLLKLGCPKCRGLIYQPQGYADHQG